VVINEIHYHPEVGGIEFVEIKSITNGPIRLFDPSFPTNTWRINGLGFDFPTNTILPPNGVAVVCGGDPATFRLLYGVPDSVPVFGPCAGTLQDGGETISIQFPDRPDIDTNNGSIIVPYIDVDVVSYRDSAPWPATSRPRCRP